MVIVIPPERKTEIGEGPEAENAVTENDPGHVIATEERDPDHVTEIENGMYHNYH